MKLTIEDHEAIAAYNGPVRPCASPISPVEKDKLIMRDLREGYGVEDIAVRREMMLKRIRRVVAEWREAGIMQDIYRGG